MSKFVILHNFAFFMRSKPRYLSLSYGQTISCFVQTEKYAQL